MTRLGPKSRTKLDDAKVRAIRTLAAQGMSQKAIAARYAVRAVTIQRVLSGYTWRHVA